MLFCKNSIDFHSPPRDRRFRVGDFAAMEKARMFGIVRLIDIDTFCDRIDVPDDESPCLEIVNAFRGHFPFGRFAVIVDDSDFDREGRRSEDERHRIIGERAGMKRYVE